MRRILLLVVLILAGLVLVAAAQAETTIDTISLWNGSDLICSFGNPNTSTYGQTVTVPADATVLRSFSFIMEMPPAAVFRGEVYAWDGSEAEGPSLFESAPTSTTSSSAQAVTFTAPQGVELSPGEQVILFATVSKDYGVGVDQTGCWGGTSDDTYAGGAFYYTNDGGNPADWTVDPWSAYTIPDTAFQANFSPPNSVSLWLGASPGDAKIDIRSRLYSGTHLVATDTLNAITPAGSGPGGSQLEDIPLTLAGPLDPAKKVRVVLDARTDCSSPDAHTHTTLYWGNGAADSTLLDVSGLATTLHLRGAYGTLQDNPGSKLQTSTARSGSCVSWQPLGVWTSP